MKFVLASIIFAYTAGSSLAADLTETPPPNVTNNWAGPSATLLIGMDKQSTSGPFGNYVRTGYGPYSVHPMAIMSGGRIGYNLQYSEYVFGAGIEIVASPKKTSYVKNINWNNGGTLYDVGSERSERASVVFIAGYSLNESLIYAVAGISRHRYSKTSYAFAGGNPFVSFSAPRNGWTLGAGIERKIYSNISASVEYRYTGFRGKEFESSALNTYDKVRLSSSTLTAGLTYRFGTQ